MSDMYLKLGTQDLTGKVYDDIKPSGGYFDIKQDGATSLVTGARKGDPKGMSVSFFVCFETEAEASAFMAYVAPYSPENPDFDEAAGADIDLFLRTSDWKYRVWGVVVKPAALGKSPLDYLQYLYEVVCYCYSPYSDGIVQEFINLYVSYFSAGDFLWAVMGLDPSDVGVAETFVIADAGGGKVSIQVAGGNYLTDNAGAIATVSHVPGEWELFTLIDQGDGYFAIQTHTGKYVSAADQYILDALATSVTDAEKFICSIGTGPIVAKRAGTRNRNSYLHNTTGHIASSPDVEIECSYNASRASNVTVAIADSETLILATQANSAETWELIGNENKLLQTYEDPITAGTQWGRDWTGDGTFDTDHIELDNGEAAYIQLSGPHPIRKPIKMTADLSLDSGGATGDATVDISPDGVSWETVLDQDDFGAGSAEYVLQGSEYMTDIYVRISCNSGASGKKVNIGSIKFEVERWIEDGAVPSVAAGATKTMTVSATGGAIAVSGSFTPRRKFL